MTRLHDHCKQCESELTEPGQMVDGFCDESCFDAYGPQCGVCGDSGWVDRIEGDVGFAMACTRCPAGREHREDGRSFKLGRQSQFMDAHSRRR